MSDSEDDHSETVNQEEGCYDKHESSEEDKTEPSEQQMSTLRRKPLRADY